MVKGFSVAILIALLIFSVQFIFPKEKGLIRSFASPVSEFEVDQPPSYPTWNPKIPQVGGASTARLLMTSEAALAYDISTETLIFEKNSSQRLPMASLTKIMTALLGLEEGDDTRYRVSESAATVGENAMGLAEGEVLTLEELLYGLLLPSGNDAAEVIAEGSKYGREGFIAEMNKRAQELGMQDTNFTNPTGLEGDGEQYTTTLDLLKLTKVAMENPTFTKVVGTYEKELPATSSHKYYHLFNDTNLLTSYPGVKGVKTGFTWEAGLCLVTYLEHNDRKIIAVLLNSQNRRQEMKDLLDYSLLALGEIPPMHE